MRRHRLGIVGAALAALALSGCGEDPGIEKGSVNFKKTDTEPLTSLTNEMKKTTQEKAHVKKSEGDGKPAAASKEAADSKPAADSKGAADTKSATKGE
jgi:hypothetical protein